MTFESLTLCRRYPPVICYSHGTFSKKIHLHDIDKRRILHCHIRLSVYLAGLLRPRTFFLISWLISSLIRLNSSTRKVDQFDHLTPAHQPWLCWSAMSLLEEPQWQDSHLAIDCQRHPKTTFIWCKKISSNGTLFTASWSRAALALGLAEAFNGSESGQWQFSLSILAGHDRSKTCIINYSYNIIMSFL